MSDHLRGPGAVRQSFSRACAIRLVVAFAGLYALSDAAAQQAGEAEVQPEQRDAYGDALPPGATQRLGTLRLRHHPHVWYAGFAVGDTCVVSSGGAELVAWDAGTGRVLWQLATPVGVFAVSPDGMEIAAAEHTGRRVHVISAVDGTRAESFDIGEREHVTALCFLGDRGQEIAYASSEGRVGLYSRSTRQMTWTSGPVGPKWNPVVIAGDASSGLLVCASLFGRVVALSTKDGSELARASSLPPAPEMAVMTGNELIALHRGAVMSRADVRTWRVLSLHRYPPDCVVGLRRDGRVLSFPEPGRGTIPRRVHRDRIAATSADGRLAVTAGPGPRVRIWDVARAAEAVALHGHDEPITALATLPRPENSWIVTGDLAGRVLAWRSGLAASREIRGGGPSVTCLAVDDRGGRFLLIVVDEYGETETWDLERATLVRVGRVSGTRVRVRHDGLLVGASEGSDILHIEHERDGQPVFAAPVAGRPVVDFALSPRDAGLAAIIALPDGERVLWLGTLTESGELHPIAKTGGTWTAIAYSGDATRLYAAREAGELVAFDREGKEAGSWRPTRMPIVAIDCARNGPNALIDMSGVALCWEGLDVASAARLETGSKGVSAVGVVGRGAVATIDGTTTSLIWTVR